MLWIIIGILASYCIGSIPTAYLFCRLIKGIDIRTVGSGNVGATNASRVLGKKLGMAVLLIDAFKGTLAVVLLDRLLFPEIKPFFAHQEIIMIIFGISAIGGHVWPVFLGFKGGKGVATTLGVLIGLATAINGLWLSLLFTVLTWSIVGLFTRIVSIASVCAAISLPVYLALFKSSFIVFSVSIVLALFIVIRHIPNLKRLIEGKEKKFF